MEIQVSNYCDVRTVTMTRKGKISICHKQNDVSHTPSKLNFVYPARDYFAALCDHCDPYIDRIAIHEHSYPRAEIRLRGSDGGNKHWNFIYIYLYIFVTCKTDSRTRLESFQLTLDSDSSTQIVVLALAAISSTDNGGIWAFRCLEDQWLSHSLSQSEMGNHILFWPHQRPECSGTIGRSWSSSD